MVDLQYAIIVLPLVFLAVYLIAHVIQAATEAARDEFDYDPEDDYLWWQYD